MADDSPNTPFLLPSLRVLEVVLADDDVQVAGWNRVKLDRSPEDNHRIKLHT